MKRVNIFLTLLIGSTLSVMSVAHESLSPSTVEQSVVAELRLKLAKFQEFSAKFKQTVFDAQGQVIQQSDGEMQVKQPNKFRWQTYQPDESLIVSDGAAVWIYNSFVEQVTAMELDTTVQQSPLWLIANQSDQSWSQFKVSHSQHGYAIIPNDPNSLTKRIVIRFNDQQISQLVIEDSQGQSSEFSLSQFDATKALDDKLFLFTMPADVDFDDQREAK